MDEKEFIEYEISIKFTSKEKPAKAVFKSIKKEWYLTDVVEFKLKKTK